MKCKEKNVSTEYIAWKTGFLDAKIAGDALLDEVLKSIEVQRKYSKINHGSEEVSDGWDSVKTLKKAILDYKEKTRIVP